MMISYLLQASPAWVERIPPDIQLGFKVVAGFVALLWGLELVDTLLGGKFDRLGIKPRRLSGLIGIPFAPCLHGSLSHLAANTGPLVILASLVLLNGLRPLLIVTGVGWIVSGVGVWLFGRPRTNHLGASGLVFSYLGFLLLRGYFEGSAIAQAIALLVGFLYGGALWGLLPLSRGRSWASHAFGFLGGALAARFWIELQQMLPGGTI